jgi:hypothetical protein
MVLGLFPSDMQGMGITVNITAADVCPLKALIFNHTNAGDTSFYLFIYFFGKQRSSVIPRLCQRLSSDWFLLLFLVKTLCIFL